MRGLGWRDPRRAWSALRAVLHALRDRLGVEDAAALGAQLPMLVRGAYYEGWHPAGKPERIRHRRDLYARVERELGFLGDVDSAEVTRVVLSVLSEHVSPGQVSHLRGILPADLRRLFPAA